MIDPSYLPFVMAGGGIILLVIFFTMYLSSSGSRPKYQASTFRWYSFF